MRYFANPSTPTVRDAMARGLLGAILTPRQGHEERVLAAGITWCADNGCFGKAYVGDEKWFAWLQRYADHASTCAFAVAPDVVGNAAATLDRSLPWLPKIRALGYPAAFVAQDGLEHLTVPWDDFDVLFIGGTTAWKLSPAAAQIAAEARRRGKPVHMGRVNSLQRMRYATHIGVDSCDGTFLTFGPEKNLPRLLAWVQDAKAQPALFGGASC